MTRRLAAAAAILLLALATAKASETVTVQVVRSLAQAPYYIALGKGYFAAEGIEIKAGEVRSALDTIGPMATGRLDVGIGAATAGFFNAAHTGFDLRVVASQGIQGPVMATPPLVRKTLWNDGTIRSGKDLRGRKVAINAPGDATEFSLTLILEKYGMETKDVDETPLAFADQVIAFKNGAIDAGFLPEPLATASVMAGDVALNEPELGVAANTVTTFVFYSTSFMRDQRPVALAFLRALIRGARDAQGDYNKNPEIAAMLGKELGVPAAAVARSVPYAADPNLDIAKFEPSLREEETIFRKDGRINYQGQLSFEAVIAPNLVREAAASLK